MHSWIVTFPEIWHWKMVISSRKVVSFWGRSSPAPDPVGGRKSFGTDFPSHPHFAGVTRISWSSPAEHDKSPTFPDFQVAAWRLWIIVDSSLIQLTQTTFLLRAQTGIYTSDSNQKNAVTFSKLSLRYNGYNFTLNWTSLVENESQN